MCIAENQTVAETDEKENGFITFCQDRREEIEIIAEGIKKGATHPAFDEELRVGGNYKEMTANLDLAYRHLEDAKMRMGKAIQAFDGGESCYKK